MTTKAPRKPRAKKAPPPPVNLIVQKTFEVKKKDSHGEDETVTFDMPEIAQAASVALALLIEGGCNTWAEFMNPDDDTYRMKALAKVIVTDELGELLDSFPTILTWITRSCSPASTVVVCPSCLEFSVTLGTVASACKITPRCDGKPLRVVRAKKATKPGAKKHTDPDDLEALEELENAKIAAINEAQNEYDNNPALRETLASAARAETVSKSY